MKILLPKKREIEFLIDTRMVVDNLYQYWFDNKNTMNDDEAELAARSYLLAFHRWNLHWYGQKPIWMTHTMWNNYWDRKKS